MSMQNCAVVVLALLCSGTASAGLQSCPSGNPMAAPDNRYSNHGDGTLSDSKTGLMWKQCSEGLSGASCTGTSTLLDWGGALQAAAASSFAGHSDWRLPNIKELQSLVETGCHGPSINALQFPNQATSPLWSATTQVASSSAAWTVEFDFGEVQPVAKSTALRTRLVRSGTLQADYSSAEFAHCAPGNPRSAPDNRYTDNADGTVTDSRTGLVWKQCVEGLSGSGCVTGSSLLHDWGGALQAAGSSSFAGATDWRLPNAKELQSLVDTGCYRPSINTTLFPNQPLAATWTATTQVATPSQSWAVDFTFGLLAPLGKNAAAPLRLVRSGPSQADYASAEFAHCAPGNPRSAPDERYTDNADGTVTDSRTALVWKQCVEGLSGSGCATGSALLNDWGGALQSAGSSSFAGATDWRLPNAKELQSLVETGCYRPSINTTLFPNQPQAALWTATTQVASPSQSWAVDFTFGLLSPLGKNAAAPLRLVRAGQATDSFIPSTDPICPPGNALVAPDSRYSDNGDGTITDQHTGLIWKQCLEGLTGLLCDSGSGALLDWSGALQTADLSAFAGQRDWRLPNVSELQSLVETGCHSPSINRAVFPGQPAATVISSTTVVASPSQAWAVSFDNGDVQALAKAGTSHLRLVRGGPGLTAYRPTLVEREVESVTAGGDAPSLAPVTDASGRFVVFQSRANNVLTKRVRMADGSEIVQFAGKGDSGEFDIYRIDTRPPAGSNPLQRISVDQDGVSVSGDAVEPSVSADGNLVVFVAPVAGVGKLFGESAQQRERRKAAVGGGIFLRNLLTGTTRQVGTASASVNGAKPQIAPSGVAVVFGFENGDPGAGALGSQVMRIPLDRQGDDVVPDLAGSRCASCKAVAVDGSDSSTLADGPSHNPVISADGNWLAWETAAKNSTMASTSPCAPTGGADSSTQIVLRNLLTGTMRRVSAPPSSSGCGDASSGASKPSIDWSGNRVAFESDQPLETGDGNGLRDAFVFDLASGRMTRVSESQAGDESDGSTSQVTISGDGSVIAYVSQASNLDPSEATATEVADVHVRELSSGVTRRLARSRSGELADGDSARPALNYNGTSLVFDSVAGNLTASAQMGQSNVYQRRNPITVEVVFAASFE